MQKRWLRTSLIWVGLATAVVVPIAAAIRSPLLAWRDPIYIVAGFAGVVAMTLLLFQPLLAVGSVPGLSSSSGRRVHRWIGGLLCLLVIIHVAALWVTSPPDVIDALLFASPTSFSAWGVIAMWALFAVIPLVALRRKLRPRTWRFVHMALAVVIVVGSVVHAILIEGTMERVSKAALCALVLAATLKAIFRFRIWTTHSKSR